MNYTNMIAAPLARIAGNNIRSDRRSLGPTTTLSPAAARSFSSSTVGASSRGLSVSDVGEQSLKAVKTILIGVSSHCSQVLLPTKATYIPNLRPTPELLTRSAPAPQPQDSRSQKIILKKFFSENGTTNFFLGTKFSGTLIRDSDEVPLEKILDHVTPSELERFETEEFIKEDEEEEEAIRFAAMRKPKGRPVGWRADMGVTYAQFLEMNGGITPSGETEINRTPGGPPGVPRQGVLRKQGRPFRNPQPIPESSADEDSSHVTGRRRPRGRPRVYSMVAAAGLGPEMGSQDESSRDITPVPIAATSVDVGGPPSKKRRLFDPTDLSGQQPHTDLKSHFEISASRSANKPQVVIPTRLDTDKASANPTQQQLHTLRRRCQICKKQRQGCDGAQPCERCRMAGIDADDCIGEDKVTFRDFPEEHAVPSVYSTSTEANIDEEAAKLVQQFQPLGSYRRAISESRSDSSASGPTITVEAYRPAQNTEQVPTPPPKKLNPASPTRRLRVFSPFRSIQEYFTKRSTPSENNSLATKETITSNLPKSHGQTAPLSRGDSAAARPQTSVAIPLPRIEDAVLNHNSRSADRAAASMTGYPQQNLKLIQHRVNTNREDSDESYSSSSSILPHQTITVTRPSNNPPAHSASCSTGNQRQKAALTQTRNDVTSKGEESDASSSSSSSVPPHESITVQPPLRSSTGPLAYSQFGVLEDRPIRRSSNGTQHLKNRSSEDAQSTGRSTAVRSSPPKDLRATNSKRIASTNDSKRIFHQGQMQQQWAEEAAKRKKNQLSS